MSLLFFCFRRCKCSALRNLVCGSISKKWGPECRIGDARVTKARPTVLVITALSTLDVILHELVRQITNNTADGLSRLDGRSEVHAAP